MQLVVRVTIRDRLPFGEPHDRYAKPSFSLTRRIRVDPELAGLVVQGALLALRRNLAAHDLRHVAIASGARPHAVCRENSQGRRNVPRSGEVSERNVTPAVTCAVTCERRGSRELRGNVRWRACGKQAVEHRTTENVWRLPHWAVG
ncbi:hypothetical protein ACFXGA_09585 [Actinosynnema sp. NPDC059335]|uniref:hypothetical protein n=1 Tax=Actinosynnema sp. NPDC059335 TaxID=3346804 RepID=UPI00366B44CB